MDHSAAQSPQETGKKRKQQLGELLVETQIITREQCDQALSMQLGGNRRIGKILMQMGLLTNDQLLEALSQQFNLPIIDTEQEASAEVAGCIPKSKCLRYDIFPIRSPNPGILRLAMADPSDTDAIDYVEHVTQKVVHPCLGRKKDIRTAIQEHVPSSWKDYLNAQTYIASTRLMATLSFLLILILAWGNYSLYHIGKYGTTTTTNSGTMYQHLDLTVNVAQTGTITLSGRAAHAPGTYNAVFPSKEALEDFVAQQGTHLSDKQQSWLQWIIAKQ